MNFKSIIFAVAVLVVAASCANSSDVTKIRGTVSAEGFDEVSVVVMEMQIDTLVPVVNGKFSIDLPASRTAVGVISAGYYRISFIPDGTKLSVELSTEPSVKSSSPKSLQTKYGNVAEDVYAINDSYMAEAQAINERVDLDGEEKNMMLEELYYNTISEFKDYLLGVFEENTDNVIALTALFDLYGIMEDDEIEEMIEKLSPEMQAQEAVLRLKDGIEIRKTTAEGRMFKDFEGETPAGKPTTLSDYIGKGKYVLVDFWASWCVPCKEELPYIKAVYDKYGKKGLDVVSVAVWDDTQASIDTAKVYGIKWNHIVGTGKTATELYGIESIPHIILFGPDGTILKRNLREEGIEEEISKYL